MFITVLKVRKSQKQFFFASIPPKNQQKIVIISALACKIGQIKKIFFGFLEEFKAKKNCLWEFWRFSDLYCFALQCRIHKYLLCITTIVWWGRRARTRLRLASVQGLHCHSLPLSLPTPRTELKCSAPQSLDSTQIFLVKPIFQSMLIQDQLAALVRSKWTPKKVQVSQAFPFFVTQIRTQYILSTY